MVLRAILMCAALLLGPFLGPGWGQTVSGTVIGVEPGTRTIILEGGRTVEVTGDTRLIVNGQPIVLENLQPGSTVTITTSGTDATARRTVRGTVTDVDRDGEVTIRIADGDEFEVRVPPETAARLKRGDAVQMDFSFTPGNAPAASPATR